MRITDRYQQHRTLSELRAQMEQLQRAQDQVSSGLKVRTMSDDPVGSPVLMRLAGSLRDIDQYQRNGQLATTRLNTEDGALSATIKLIEQARSIAQDGSSQSVDATTRQGLLQQVKQIFDQVVALGNTTYGDEYVFAGGKTQTPAFTTTGQYAGDDTVRQVQLDTHQVMDVSHPGDQVFGQALTALNGLMQQLSTGAPGASASSINALDAARATVQTVQNDTAARIAQVQSANSLLTSRANTLQQQHDGIAVADPTESMVSLVTLQNAMERAYAAIGKVLQTHLTDFLQ